MALCCECGAKYDAGVSEACSSGNEPHDYHIPDESRCHEVVPEWVTGAGYTDHHFEWVCSLPPDHDGPHRAHSDSDVTNDDYVEWETDLPDLTDVEAVEEWLTDA